MTSHTLFEKLPPVIQLKIWVEYFKQIVIHKIGISRADEESHDPIFPRARRHGPNIPQIPLNTDGDLVYITDLHFVLLGKLCSPSGACSGGIKRVALLFNRETPELSFSLPGWGHHQRNAATSRVALEEVIIVMAASRRVVPTDQLLLGRRDRYGFMEFGTASLPFLASWEIRLAQFFFRKWEESLGKAKFPLRELVKIRRVIDINA
ncbi:hypothetical protein K449DRAFT_467771 [Hypoxylon sp. EC38]|nr:hypothetical protein K449DRAFT_467771 [Hypoxylon sp. EC38]